MTFNTFQQKKLDAICAIQYHEARLSKLQTLDVITEILSISLPVVYLSLRYLAKGTSYERIIESTSELLAAALFIMTIAKLKSGWADKISKHKQQIAANLNLATQADQMLSHGNVTNDATLFFTLLADKIEEADRDLLPRISKEEEVRAYREGLKRFGSDVLCPICNLSPFKFMKGLNPCQTCGNSSTQIVSKGG